jgi:hypothetical protein
LALFAKFFPEAVIFTSNRNSLYIAELVPMIPESHSIPRTRAVPINAPADAPRVDVI